ncbi:tapetum determinant 1 [Quillaja saponaria]|uniref:Tapetum determinant 1 n=1 Tax=Quillaja saponaria TaxID=32244 RepID=A0AAD7P986_QUISA|nr:tapetum determinant 1 [Quillaja saponaria]
MDAVLVLLGSPKAQKACIVSLAAILIVLLHVRELIHLEGGSETCIKRMALSKANSSTANVPRKLLQSADEGDMNRIGTSCSKDDIVIYQGQTSPLPNGIPSYTVEILNMCASDCSIANIHVRCGWFSSARLVNPRVFRRLDFDDCLVNSGEPLGPGESLSFEYANTYSYPLSVSSVSCS